MTDPGRPGDAREEGGERSKSGAPAYGEAVRERLFGRGLRARRHEVETGTKRASAESEG